MLGVSNTWWQSFTRHESLHVRTWLTNVTVSQGCSTMRFQKVAEFSWRDKQHQTHREIKDKELKSWVSHKIVSLDNRSTETGNEIILKKEKIVSETLRNSFQKCADMGDTSPELESGGVYWKQGGGGANLGLSKGKKTVTIMNMEILNIRMIYCLYYLLTKLISFSLSTEKLAVSCLESIR